MHICPQEIAIASSCLGCLVCARGWVKARVLALCWAIIDRLDP